MEQNPFPPSAPRGNTKSGDQELNSLLDQAPTQVHQNFFVTHEAKRQDLSSHIGELPDLLCETLQPIIDQQHTQILDFTEHLGQFIWDHAQVCPLFWRDWPLQWMIVVPLETHANQMGALLCGGHGENRHLKSHTTIANLESVARLLTMAIQKADCHAQNRAINLAAQTQKKYLQEALQNFQKAQSQLIQSEKMSSLGQLVAGVAHEINNPVNFIAGNLQHAEIYITDLLELLDLYESHCPNPVPCIQDKAESMDLQFLEQDYPNMLKSMKMGTARIQGIVQSLRTFSRLDEAEIKSVDIHEGLESTLTILESRLRPRNGQGSIEVQRQYGIVPPVECYAGQLNQVFMNLLSNAIDALENQPNPRIITIKTQTVPAPLGRGSDWLSVTIQDNGTGLDPQVQEKIFNPFFTTKPPGQGTGLGLSISYQIISDRHQGTLHCESTLGQGTAFILKIPVTSPRSIC